jgi:hypothetical protein
MEAGKMKKFIYCLCGAGPFKQRDQHKDKQLPLGKFIQVGHFDGLTYCMKCALALGFVDRNGNLFPKKRSRRNILKIEDIDIDRLIRQPTVELNNKLDDIVPELNCRKE